MENLSVPVWDAEIKPHSTCKDKNVPKKIILVQKWLSILFKCIWWCIIVLSNSQTASHTHPPDKSAQWKISFVIFQPKHMLWVLKSTY